MNEEELCLVGNLGDWVPALEVEKSLVNFDLDPEIDPFVFKFLRTNWKKCTNTLLL